MTENILTQSILKEHLHYDTETGIFTRIKSAGGQVTGNTAGCIGSGGYVNIKVFGVSHKAHHLAWLYFYGNTPNIQIDHINGVRTDNRIQNLRLATNAQNTQNTKLYKSNSTGYFGVSYHKRILRYQSRITISNRTIHLGYYDTPEEAHQVYCDAKLQIHTFNPVLRES